ncbi:MAG: NifB/NifX family molybdenum-iron cluster-binding protein [Desulfobacterales bacterium]
MNETLESEFCMKEFKPAIAGLTILIIVVLGWTVWHANQRQAANMDLSLAAAAVSPMPVAIPINVKDKMVHAYWGNCNKCHVTIDAGKPISKVMAAAPVSVKDKMLHKYWGNCLLCHKVTDGFQPKNAAAATRKVALNQLTTASLGVKGQSVTGAMMQKFGLSSEDGVLILSVDPGSIAEKAGLRAGDEILRVDRARVDSTQVLEAAINRIQPGSRMKFNISRGKRGRNLMVKIPDAFSGNLNPAATMGGLIQTLPGRQTRRLVPLHTTQPLYPRARGAAGPNLNYGKVAIATSGPGLGYSVSNGFGSSAYFIIYDPKANQYRVLANPNANDATGRGIQTSQYLVDLGVCNVIAGSYDPDAIHSLRTLRVNVFSGANGSADGALSDYLASQAVGGFNARPNQRVQQRQALSPPRQAIRPLAGNNPAAVQMIY